MIKNFSIFLLLSILVFFSCENEDKYTIQAAKHGNTASKVKALKVLKDKNYPKLFSILVGALNDRSPLVRKTAALLLENSDIKATWPLIHRLNDSDVRVRSRVVRTLFTLPNHNEIHFALIKKLDDSSLIVRKEIRKGFFKKGWSRKDILLTWEFSQRLKSYDLLSSKINENRAYGLKLLTKIGNFQDLPFIYTYLQSDDTFLRETAQKGISSLGDVKNLSILLANYKKNVDSSIFDLIKNIKFINKEHIKKLAESQIDFQKALSFFPLKHDSIPCKYMVIGKYPENIKLFSKQNCKIVANIPVNEEIVYKLYLNKEISKEFWNKVKVNLNKINITVLKDLIARPEFQDDIIQWLTKEWEKFIYHYDKWIPEKLWSKLELVGKSELAPLKITKQSKRERLLSVYKAKINIIEERELLLPKFNLQFFINRIQILHKIEKARPFLLSIFDKAPENFKKSVVYALYPAKSSIKVPPQLIKCLKSSDLEVKYEVVKTLSGHLDIKTLLPLLDDYYLPIGDVVINVISKVGGENETKILIQRFRQDPTAKLAQALAKLKVTKIIKDLVSILMEDTSKAMSKDRAQVLESYLKLEKNSKNTLEIYNNESWHPSPVVRCTALKNYKNKKVRAIHQNYDPSLFVRKCLSR
jgi:hypothetical protein